MVAKPLHNGVPVELPRVLSVQNARLLGITRSAMRNEMARGRWQRLVPGVVLTERGEPAREDWVWSASSSPATEPHSAAGTL